MKASLELREFLGLFFDFFIGLRKCYGFPSLWSFHAYLFKIKSFLGKFTAFLPVNKPWRSVKFCPILPFLVAKLYLSLPGSIILTRQVMIQGMDLTNPYWISSISSDSYIPIPIFALHHRHKTQTSELIGILHNLLSLVVLVESGVPDLSDQFFFSEDCFLFWDFDFWGGFLSELICSRVNPRLVCTVYWVFVRAEFWVSLFFHLALNRSWISQHKLPSSQNKEARPSKIVFFL